jgi:UPF0755 protein
MIARKSIKIGMLVSMVIVGLISIKYAFLSNTKFDENEVYIKIPHNANYEQVKKIISPFIDNYSDFEMIARLRQYPNNIKTGRFLFKKGMSSFSLSTALRHNIVVKLSFNNQERLEDLAGRVASQIEADSISILKVFRDSLFLNKNGFNEETVFVTCLPNTYEMYWDTTAEEFRDKMLESYQDFWDDENIDLAEENNLTPIQATILASIVHKETAKKTDRPKIAAVYINRMKIAMPLQADPTNIFGRKKLENNFKLVIKQVLAGDLKINSPYNTYTAITALLNPDKHNYLYFCASAENFGSTEFAETFEEHLAIAKKYREWVNKQGYKR